MFGTLPVHTSYLRVKGLFTLVSNLMKKPSRLVNFKAPVALIADASAAAQLKDTTLSAVLRQYMAKYAASALKGTK